MVASVRNVLAMILMVLMVTLTAVSLVREKETGTLQQILVMPLPPYVFLLGRDGRFVTLFPPGTPQERMAAAVREQLEPSDAAVR